MLIVGSGDCLVSVWRINPDNEKGIREMVAKPELTLNGHHNCISAVAISG
jgi:hypothetical protein